MVADVLVVAGTHGKTSTTALLATIFTESGSETVQSPTNIPAMENAMNNL